MSATPRVGADPLTEIAGAGDAAEISESDPAPFCLFGLEFSLDTASLDALEQVARSVRRGGVADWFARFGETEEVALLSTCHRVELAGITRFPEEVGRWRAALPGHPLAWKPRWGREVVSHLFRVAAGRESLAVGEAEVREQVRAAASFVRSRHPRPVLRTILLEAVRAAEELSPSTGNLPSVAEVAGSRLMELVSGDRPRVVVVGAGTVGRQVVETVAPVARVTVVYHQTPPEESFLREMGAEAVGLERLSESLAHADAVVTAAKFGHHGLHVADLPRDRPIVLVDLGVPRNIDPEVRTLPNARLVDLEELHRLTDSGIPPDRGDERLELRALACWDQVVRHLLEPWVEAFRRAAEDVRRSELASARRHLGELDARQEHAVDLLTRRLVARLLRSPTERLRSFPAGPEGDLMRRWALELLRPDSSDP